MANPSNVLGSERAVQANIEIMHSFVRLRSLLATDEDLARRLDEIAERYNARFVAVFDAIRRLMQPPEPSRRTLGFPVRHGS